MSRVYLLIAVAFSIIMLMSWSANPPDGHSGAPGDGLCSDCHTLNGGTQTGSITLTGFPAMIQPSTAYVLTITNSNPNGIANRAGFQMTILNASNQQAGTMTSPSMNSVVTPFLNRQYWEHNPAQPYPVDNMVSWTVTWTSPAGPTNNTLTYYAAGNVANGNFDSTGDLIVTSTGSGILQGGGPLLTVDILGFTNVSCFNGNDGSAIAGASGGIMPYTFNWSTGTSGSTVNNLFAGTYFVTVTDNVGSTATTSVSISEPPEIVLSPPVINHVSCFGGSNGSILANASGGAPPYMYNWSNGAAGANNTGLSAGNYTLTVTDSDDCTKTATYQVTQPPDLVINLINLDHESCSGEEDGVIMISATGGVSPYFAEWSNGFIGTTITDLAPGAYDVTVTDNNNCTETASYVINEGGVLNVMVLEIQHVTCNGGTDGSISLTASGGVPPYNYVWSNGATGASVANLAAGNYLVTVTDNNGCGVVNFYTINQPGAISIQINQTGQNLCSGDADVTLTATVGGGAPPFTSIWSNGIQTLTNANLSAGTYTITITDSDACSATSSSIVTAPPPVTAGVMTTHETEEDANDGTATATGGGGTPGYTYVWSNGENTQTISGLAPGNYTVTITDMNGCTSTASGQVNPFGCTLNVTILASSLAICEGDTVLLEAMVTGATGTVSYLWSISDTTASIATGVGLHCVTVSDESGCQAEACIVIQTIPEPIFTCPVMHESAPGAGDGAILCDTIPGVISYLWSNGAITPGISGLEPGEYCLTITDQFGCENTSCFIIQAGNCQLVITSVFGMIGCSGGTGFITVNVENATPPVTFAWSSGDTTSTAQNLSAGFYAVTVSDSAGCVEVLNFVLSQPEPLSIVIDSIGHISDFETGSVFITPSGGVPPYSIVWLDPEGNVIPGEDITDLDLPGYYQVMLEDANGCELQLDSIEVELFLATSPDPVFKTLKAYPVPTGDILYIDIDRPIREVLISGADGRLYKRVLQPVNNAIAVEDLEQGWYIVRIADDTSWYVARMVK